MNALDAITELVSEAGKNITRADLNTILTLAVDVPLEDSDYLGFVWEGIALTINDPLYTKDIKPEDIERL